MGLGMDKGPCVGSLHSYKLMAALEPPTANNKL